MNMSPRLALYLGIVAALALGVLIAIFFGSASVFSPSTDVAPIASSSMSIAQNNSEPLVVIPDAAQTIATTTAPTPATPTSKKNVVLSTPAAASVTVFAPASSPPSQQEFEASSAVLRAALVNIICYVPPGSGLRSISGSGVIIDAKGIILTNAHIAQYFLLADHGVSCVIRSGNPATNKYTAALMYISPPWVRANSGVLTETMPGGTGEHDFALLAITKSAGGGSASGGSTTVLPSSFPYVALAIAPPLPGTPVVIASYGAQFLESNQIQSNLFPTVVFGSVKDVFTFAVNTVDVLALGGSAAAQEGSSGGGVVATNNTLVGTITTSTVTGATATRSLSAITASYIRADYAGDTGQPIDLLLAQSPAAAVANFAPQIPALESILTAQLP